MKNMKTWLSALLAVMMLLAMTGIAMADAVPTGSITVENLESGETVTIYQVIEIESDGTAALKDPKWVSGIQDWIATEYPEYADAANLPADGSTGVSKSTFYNAPVRTACKQPHRGEERAGQRGDVYRGKSADRQLHGAGHGRRKGA